MEPLSRLLVFTDPGLDDAMALIYLLRCLPSNVRIDIFCVGGNNSAFVSYQNACSLLSNYKRSEVYIWETDCISQNYDSLVNVHGSDFLGLPYTQYGNSKVYPVDWDGVSENCSILVLAACTLPLLLNIDYKYISDLVVMGGCESQPNYNGLEFNQAMDVFAFSAFIEKYINKARIITVDSCRNSFFDIYNSNYRDYLDELCNEYRCFNLYEKYALKRGSKYCIPYDLIAAFALLNKKQIIYKKMPLIGLKELEPTCMVGTHLQDSKEFWNIIWEK